MIQNKYKEKSKKLTACCDQTSDQGAPVKNKFYKITTGSNHG